MFAAFVLSITASAQTARDTLSHSVLNYSEKSLISSFDKQLNTYNYLGSFKYNFQSDNFFIGIKENFNSTIISSLSKNIKDEQYFSALSQYSFSDQFKTGLNFNHTLYTDDRSFGLNKASLLMASAFIKYSPFKQFNIVPFYGYSQNTQINITDKGFLYGTEAELNKFEYSDFELSSLFKFSSEDISPRKNTNRLLDLTLTNSFEQGIENSIQANFIEQRRDFYLPSETNMTDNLNAASNIQSRIESNYLIQDRIKINPENSNFAFDIQGRASWREITKETKYSSVRSFSSSNYDTRIEEFKLELASSAEYNSDKFNITFRFSFSEKDEKHQPISIVEGNEIIFNEQKSLEEQKNNSSILANMSLSSKFYLSHKDIVTLNLFHRKLQYDTPSKLNPDDRDELLSIGQINYQHLFNTFFRGFLTIEGSLNTISYIFSERSSNNNIKRILKLASGGTFTSGDLVSSNSAEVLANYTVFDYEELNPNFRSYSFRQFTLRDSTSYSFNKDFKILFNGYIKLSEQGDFSWTSFTGKPLRFLEEKYLEPRLFYGYTPVQLIMGIKFFSISTFNILNGKDKLLVSEYQSLGPTAEISYFLSDKLQLRIYGWYEFIKSEDNLRREMMNGSLRLNYRL